MVTTTSLHLAASPRSIGAPGGSYRASAHPCTDPLGRGHPRHTYTRGRRMPVQRPLRPLSSWSSATSWRWSTRGASSASARGVCARSRSGSNWSHSVRFGVVPARQPRCSPTSARGWAWQRYCGHTRSERAPSSSSARGVRTLLLPSTADTTEHRRFGQPALTGPLLRGKGRCTAHHRRTVESQGAQPDRKTRVRNCGGVVEHADATTPPPRGNTLRQVEPDSDQTSNPPQAAATTPTSISDAERELNGRLCSTSPTSGTEGR